jgi:hypothetical protein
VILVVILLALFFMLRKKKPATTQPDQRVAANIGAQQSRRPTTQFATSQVKPVMGAGTVPQRPAVAPQQIPSLPTTQPQTQTQPQTEEQRDWNWNFNE